MFAMALNSGILKITKNDAMQALSPAPLAKRTCLVSAPVVVYNTTQPYDATGVSALSLHTTTK